MPPLDMDKLSNPDHWFELSPGAPSAYYAIATVFYAALLAASLYVYIYKGRLFPTNRLHLKLAELVSGIGLVLAGSALFLLLTRYLEVPYLSVRGLFYLVVMNTIVFGLFLYYYLKVEYPKRLASYLAARTQKARVAESAPPDADAQGSSKRQKARRRR